MLQSNRNPSSASVPAASMAYQILARKWRPQDFSGVVGQRPIVTALRNAVSEGRIAQAYLFSGIRGVGKTSVARVLAKALNCEQGPAADPCNACAPCREITAGSDLDVLEIDAATYSKVEQVRELTESLKYGPTRDRYKVVVIDEIHRLSRQAFDALLKTVEEPPPHLVFLFATTEIEAVPATILSRCQEFHFRRVSVAGLVAHLRRIADAEKISASDKALRLVARAGEGSVRDAVALLDQLATYGSGEIPEDEATRILGGVDAAVLHKTLAALLGGQRDEIAAVVAAIEQEGWDPRRVYSDFLVYCRDALHLSLGGDTERVDLPEEEAGALADLARSAGFEALLRVLHLLLTSEMTVRRSEAASLALEVVWLRAAELPRLTRIEALLAGQSGTSVEPLAEPRLPRRPDPPPAASRAGSQAPAGNEPLGPAVASPGQDAAAKGESPEPLVSAFVEAVSRRKQPLAAHLAEAHALQFADGELLICTSPDDPWLRTALRRGNNRRVLEECLTATWGHAARWRIQEEQPPGPADPAPPPETAAAINHPTVQAALDIFGGSVRTTKQEP